MSEAVLFFFFPFFVSRRVSTGCEPSSLHPITTRHRDASAHFSFIAAFGAVVVVIVVVVVSSHRQTTGEEG